MNGVKYEGLDEITITGKLEEEGNGLHVVFKGDKAEINYSRRVEFFRGLSYVKQWIDGNIGQMEIMEKPVFKNLTFMLDCSRNAVVRMDFLKDMIQKLAWMGYNRLMLYTEDTYEIEDEPYYGYMRGRFTQAQLKEIDEHAFLHGIEMVPCIQTLAHLNAIFRWKRYENIRDTGDILCCGEEQTYELIEKMVSAYAKAYRTRVIHIGMDEAEMIGRGSFLNRFGYQKRIDIMERHLKRVLEICHKYGYTCMMWSDMFFKMISGGNYYNTDTEIPEEMRRRIPDGLELIYWDYYARDSEKYDRMLARHKKMSNQVGFAGGAWKWNAFAPLLNHSMTAGRMALDNCLKHGITDVMVTAWGDDGSECSQAAVWPVLAMYAEFNYAGCTDDKWVAGRLKACTGAELYDFLQLDQLNLTPDNPAPGRVSVTPGKYLLYQDVLLGIYDVHIDPQTYPEHFRVCREELGRIAAKGGDYAYIFETLKRLAAVLEIKADLGIRLKQAYDAKDRKALRQTAEDCGRTIVLVEKFQEAQRIQWYLENRSFGYDVQEIRLGALKERLRAAERRIGEYLDGKIEIIEELEEHRLPLDDKKNQGFETLPLSDCGWKNIVTPSVL